MAVTAAVLLAAILAAASLWRGAARQPWPDLRAYRWFTIAIAAGLVCASVIVGQAVPASADAAPMLSFTDLPSLLVLPVMAAGLAGLASAARRELPEAPSARRAGRGLATAGAYLADGYVLAGRALADVERDLIRENLKLFGGNREKTARVLRIGERTLYRKIKEYGL